MGGFVDKFGGALIGPIQLDANMRYSANFSNGGKVFSGGETFTVKASGGQVPAFSLSATAPHLIEVMTPDPDNVSVALDAAHDFPVAWLNGKDGTVKVDVHVDPTDTGKSTSEHLSCVFPAASGKGVVPAAALEKLLTVPGGLIGGRVTISATSDATVNAGKFFIDMSVTAGALEKPFTLH
jgi:hypothetical protein